MSIQTRRERERAERQRLIVTAARELAEAEGWDAVTTRRLADQVEYSQPVLYSHFKGKTAIMAAVAVEGFADLAAELRAVRTAATGPERPDVGGERVLLEIGAAYAGFADRRPVLYDTMFTEAVELPFATPEAPPELQDAFGELRETVRPLAKDDNLEVLTETFWSGLHGLVTLMRHGRLRREDHDRRLALFISRMSQ